MNAVVHRSYGNGLKTAMIFVKMFEDRLEIESPGPFMPTVNPDNIYESTVPRNPFLMDTMYFLDYVRAANEGTRRMKAEMINMELPVPEFVQEIAGQSKVRVVLRNKINQRKQWVDSDIAELIGATMLAQLTEEEKRYLNFIAINEKITVADAQRLIPQDWKTASKNLKRLVQKGLLTHVHRHSGEPNTRDPQAYYCLKSDFVTAKIKETS